MQEAVKTNLRLYGSRQQNIAKLLLNLHFGRNKQYNIGGTPATPEELTQFCAAWKRQKPDLDLPQKMDTMCSWFNRWREKQHKADTSQDDKMLRLPDRDDPNFDRIQEAELKRVSGIPA